MLNLITMNMQRFKQNKTIAGLLTAVILLTGISCRTTVDFPHSSIVPAADVKASIKQDDHDNYKIKLEAEHLADPQRLRPSKDVYVVWLETEDNNNQNIGQLTTNSKKKGKLETTSPYQPVRIFITAEDRANIDYPRGEVVFESRRIN